MPAVELVEEAKKQGFKLSPGFIYNIRAADKKRGGGPRSYSARSSAGGSRASAKASGSMENQLRSVILRMGLDGAEAVFADLRAKMKTLST